mmetsp:Transcript_6448/g.8721  ORF Transcript_6448/g.8721 Transcript_6448/m.8721 type:complete len:398 (+) Transcript_6448:352-1545(+)
MVAFSSLLLKLSLDKFLLLDRSSSKVCLRHNRRMVMAYLPLAIFKYINEGITTLHLGTINSHCEFIHTSILSPVCTNDNVTIKNFTLGLLLEEAIKVILDQSGISTRNIRHGGKENSLLGIASSDLVRIKSGKSTVPQLEKVTNLVLGDGSGQNALGHDGRMVVADLPLTVLQDIHKGIATLHLRTINSHGEFVDASILCPVGSNDDLTLKDFALGLLLEEAVKVVSDSLGVVPGLIGNCGEENSFLGIAGSNGGRVASGKSIIPKVEEVADTLLRDGCGNINALRHDGGMVVDNLPFTVFENVVKGVSRLNLRAIGAHGEFVHTCILGPVDALSDLTLYNGALGLLKKEGIEVVFDGVVVSSGGVRDGRKEDGALGITLGNNIRLSSGKGIVPKLK